MKLKNLFYSAVILFLAGCAPELTEQDVIDAYKSQAAKDGGYYIEGEIKLEDFEVVHQWEASLTYKCGDEICMSTLIHEDGKWRVR